MTQEHWIAELALYIFLLSTAVLALQLPKLLAAVVATSAYSFVCAVLFIAMGAVDVGFTEAVVGAGIVGVFFISALLQTKEED